MVGQSERYQLVFPRALPGTEVMLAHYISQDFLGHSHNCATVIAIESGQWELERGGQLEMISEGQLSVVNIGEPHGGRPVGEGGAVVRRFSIPDTLFKVLIRDFRLSAHWPPRFREGVIIDRPLSEQLIALQSRLLKEDPPAGDLDPQELEPMVRLVERYARDGEVGVAPKRPVSPEITAAVGYARDHFAEEVPLEVLAEVAGMSRFHFLRVFREAVGFTPHNYLTLLRLEHARGLLSAGVALQVAAERCGFHDQSHFTRRFKQTYGYTPGVFVEAWKRYECRA